MQNPADIPTRGSYLKDDNIKEFWLKALPFLQLSQENYKSNESHCLVELSKSEIDTDMNDIFSSEKYNSFEKLIRVTSFVLRFIDNIKLKVVDSLTLDETNCAKYLLIKNEQKGFLSSKR